MLYRFEKKLGLLLCALSLTTPSFAEPPAQQAAGLWGFFMLQGQLSPKFRSSLETHLRGDENRIWQQLVYDSTGERLRSLMRIWLEERFFVGIAEILLRLRILLRSAIALDSQRLWQIVAQDEVFLHLNSIPSGPISGLDQNRLQMTVQRQVSPWWSMDIGYQLQYQLQSTQADRMSHNVVWINTFRIPIAGTDSPKDIGTQE